MVLTGVGIHRCAVVVVPIVVSRLYTAVYSGVPLVDNLPLHMGDVAV